MRLYYIRTQGGYWYAGWYSDEPWVDDFSKALSVGTEEEARRMAKSYGKDTEVFFLDLQKLV